MGVDNNASERGRERVREKKKTDKWASQLRDWVLGFRGRQQEGEKVNCDRASQLRDRGLFLELKERDRGTHKKQKNIVRGHLS